MGTESAGEGEEDGVDIENRVEMDQVHRDGMIEVKEGM